MDGITDSMDMSLSKLREMVKDRVAWRAVVHGAAERGTRPRKHHTYSTETLGPQSPRRSFADANGVKLHNVPLGPTVPTQELYRCQRSETSQCATWAHSPHAGALQMPME